MHARSVHPLGLPREGRGRGLRERDVEERAQRAEGVDRVAAVEARAFVGGRIDEREGPQGAQDRPRIARVERDVPRALAVAVGALFEVAGGLGRRAP